MKKILLLCFVLQSLLISNVFNDNQAEKNAKSLIKSIKEYKLHIIRATTQTHNYRLVKLINGFVTNTPELKKMKNRKHGIKAANIALNRVTKAVKEPKAHLVDYDLVLKLCDKIISDLDIKQYKKSH